MRLERNAVRLVLALHVCAVLFLLLGCHGRAEWDVQNVPLDHITQEN